jgi:two-component system response regulator HydG
LPWAHRLTVFPINHENEYLGSLLVACPENCRCITKELEVIDLILKQTSGTIKRAALHEEEICNLQSRLELSTEYSGIVGKDPMMQTIYKLIEDIAPTDATVLIEGESGTGKEPFIVINCSAYPATLLESELFGHEKGAFTGAIRQKIGRFELADGGTIFLDEVGEIPASAQIKLLRVLQNRKFERLGGEQTLSVNVRIVSATNKNLLQEVKSGRFREDLFYRLKVIPILLPPLRNRANDIPLLARHFLHRFSGEQKKVLHEFDSESIRMLMNYPWPGNVRELENSIEHAVVLAKGETIEVSDLPSCIRNTDHQAMMVTTAATSESAAGNMLMENEAKLLREALEASGWNKKAAARCLGISRSTLYEKIKKYRISPTIH